MWPFNLIHAFSGSPNQSVSQSCRASSCCMHSVSQPVIQFSWSFRLSCVTHQSFASFVHSFSSSQLIHSYSADDSGAKRKYRELKRLPADIRAQVALLKVHHTYTTWSPPPLPLPRGKARHSTSSGYSTQNSAALHQCCPLKDGALHTHACLTSHCDESVFSFLRLLRVHGIQGVQQDLACQLKPTSQVTLSCCISGFRATQRPRALLRE